MREGYNLISCVSVHIGPVGQRKHEEAITCIIPNGLKRKQLQTISRALLNYFLPYQGK